MTARTVSSMEKPLPSLPSPTLTNPDMVLPSSFGEGDARSPSTTPSPPSPTYLKDFQHGTNDEESSQKRRMQSFNGGSHDPPKREKRGLMSRKMMLLRSRNGSGINANGAHAQEPTPQKQDGGMNDGTDLGRFTLEASLPVDSDSGNLAPETRSDSKRISTGASSFNSEDFAAIPSFLRKYEALGDTTDDDLEYGYSVSVEGGGEAQRKAQEEHNSAVLSRRAEEILANAKKRLNLMEGNLRGARDLVAPLTAANLRRATSLGPSDISPGSKYSSKARPAPDAPQNEPSTQPVQRTLHSQASSPTMGREFHARGFSESTVPDRPQTAMAKSGNFLRKGRIPVKRADEPSWSSRLRISQSQETLRSSNGYQRPGSRDRPRNHRGSPDSTLEPLAEDETGNTTTPSPDGIRNRGLHRPSSNADNLREKVSSLHGKIAGLKERNREDNLRRQSLQKLRTPSPLNNAEIETPAMFHVPPPSNSIGGSGDDDAGVGALEEEGDEGFEHTQVPYEGLPQKGGSRNAFAEAAQYESGRESRASKSRSSQGYANTAVNSQHKRTPSGTAVVEPAAIRYPHHQRALSREMPGAFKDDETVHPYTPQDGLISPLDSGVDPIPDYDHIVSDNESIYEDAKDKQAPMVAHEDRADAFDYEHFFLHSALGSYNRGRRSPESSDGSVTSVETAKAPHQEMDDNFAKTSANFPPPTPETPEELRKIERNLYHRRTESSESASTLQSFATADEDHGTPSPSDGRKSALNWPFPPSINSSSTTTPRPSRSYSGRNINAHQRQGSSSDRADSGVGMHKPQHTENSRTMPASTAWKRPTTPFQSPPMSPQQQVKDPASLAVNALLDHPHGKPLGLKDKALLFGVVEELRKTCSRFHETEESSYDRRALRRQLEGVKKALAAEYQ